MPEGAPPRPAVLAITALRRALLALADRLVPAHLAMFDKAIGIGRTHLYGTIAELGVADELAKGKATAAELAGRLGVDPDALHRALRAACVDRVLKLDRRGRFSLTRTGRTLTTDHPHSDRDFARFMALKSISDGWVGLTETIRTGEPGFRAVHGMTVWEWFVEHPEEERLFAGAMRWLTENQAPFIVGGYPWPESGTICDVAGGAGTLLGRILQERPGARGIVIDAKGVLDAADQHLSAVGVRDRVELVEGNMFERLEADADVYLLKNILHDWDDASCLQILRVVRAMMSPGSRLVVVEALQERNRPHPFASFADVQMLTHEGGRERSAEELKRLLSDAGLRPGEIRETAGPALIEAFAGD
jgi:hypothetical protein